MNCEICYDQIKKIKITKFYKMIKLEFYFLFLYVIGYFLGFMNLDYNN